MGPTGRRCCDVEPAEPAGFAITYAVTNEGTKAGRAKCQLVALDADGQQLRTRGTVTSQIAGGASAELTETVPGLQEEPASVTVSCS